MLVDLTDMGVTGKEAERVADDVCITVNKTQSFDTQSPFNLRQYSYRYAGGLTSRGGL